MSQIQSFYKKLDVVKGFSEDALFSHVLKQFLPVPNSRLLDIGCLEGIKTVLAREVVQASETYGIDFIENRFAEAEARGIHTQCIDLNNELPLRFSSEYFDVILCSEVIEHLFSPDDLMDEIARLLRPGGYAIITTPNLACWKNRLVMLFGWQPFYTEISTRARYGNPLAPAGLPSGHIRLFTQRALCELARASGLQVEKIANISSSEPTRILISKASRIINAVIVPLWPSMGDRIILRLRKPGRHY